MLKAYSTFTLFKKISSAMFSILLSLLVVSCSSTPTQQLGIIEQQSTNGWLLNKAILEKIQQFSASGKVSFKNEKQSISANFSWRQDQHGLSLRLTNFFGSTLLKLDSNAAGTTIVDHNGKSYFGNDMSTLIQSLTGVDLPIEELANWLKGLPSQNNGYRLNEYDTLARLSQYQAPNEQLGWQIAYQSYGKIQEVLLPQRLNMTNQDQQVNLTITQWKL